MGIYPNGSSERPNVEALIEAPESKIKGQIFNVGHENKSVLELANIVKKIVGEDVVLKTTQSNDNRSYHISSNKIKKVLDFNFNFTITNAVEDLILAFEKKLFNSPLSNEKYFNIKTMNKIQMV